MIIGVQETWSENLELIAPLSTEKFEVIKTLDT